MLDYLINGSKNNSNTEFLALLRQINILSDNISSFKDNASSFEKNRNFFNNKS